jgi:hypothetical protein
MIDRESSTILNKLVARWDEMQIDLQRLYTTATIRPTNGAAVFKLPPIPDPNTVDILFDSIVFNLPERATHSDTKLFVVATGNLSFDRATYRDGEILLAHAFATRVAYFRWTKGALDHVFGAHYDFSDNIIGHPAFHAQFRSFASLSNHIQTEYRVEDPVNDFMGNVLEGVRLPTAHMDIFSLFLQLCADHLLHNRSGSVQKAVFNSLVEKNAFCRGTAFRIPRLVSEAAYRCYRSGHWYPILP